MTRSARRIDSLDILRGLTIALMILVNTPGSWEYVYAPFRHATWNGATLTDLIFPMFLFIIGISISVSMDRLSNTSITASLFFKTLKRSVILFAIGLFLNLIPSFDFATVRIPGVLQRIAIVFFINALLFISTSHRTQIVISAGILSLYWMLLIFVPFNGQIPDILTPTNNLTAYIDSSLLKGHMWSVTNTWDPEGLLSTLPAVASTMIGMTLGSYLKKTNYSPPSLIISIFIGASMIVAGLILNTYLPINKSIWTSTFVIFTSGVNIISYILLYTCIDRKKLLPSLVTKPFIVFGSNAITAYVLSGTVAVLFYSLHVSDLSIKQFLYDLLTQLVGNQYFSSLLYALMFTILIYIPILMLYRNKIHIKI